MHVLVAEDDPTSRELVCRLLEKLNYTPIPCENGAIAWEKFQEFKPKICIIDWEMPVMTGLELCRKITEHDPLFPCQKIMFTARGQKDDLLKALQAGASDYITKPVEADQLGLRLQVAELNLQQQILQLSEKSHQIIQYKLRELQQKFEGISSLSCHSKKSDSKNNKVDLENILSRHQARLEKAGVKASISSDTSFETCVNSESLISIIDEAIKNSIEATEGLAPAEITLSFKEMSNSIEVCIADNGENGDFSDNERLFDPFYTSKDSHVHLGIGLTTARAYAFHLGGSVSLDREGSQTVFRLTFPHGKKLLKAV